MRKSRHKPANCRSRSATPDRNCMFLRNGSERGRRQRTYRTVRTIRHIYLGKSSPSARRRARQADRSRRSLPPRRSIGAGPRGGWLSVSLLTAIAFLGERLVLTGPEAAVPACRADAESCQAHVYVDSRSARERHVTLGGSHFGPLTWAFRGGEGTRTLGLYIANVALCQLSYTPGTNRQASPGAARARS